ncbi:hypothetical protein M885DRAFT_613152 [Pelagophyceae sp. CCMP2097]|nr:hypothetical protein M885DRAFT_613152 [Pelagophyceae sp. CCMP2097]
MSAPQPMTVERAKLILREAIALFSLPENVESLASATAKVNAAPEEQRASMKMMLLIPIVTQMCQPKLIEHGIPNVMMGIFQIQAVAQEDTAVKAGVAFLTNASMGNLPDPEAVKAMVAQLA